MPALLAAARVVAFPVDDLYGKVDVPLVLLEAMALGIPVIVARGGPLEALSCAPQVEPGDSAALAAECTKLLTDSRLAEESVDAGKALYAARFSPKVVAAAYDDLYGELLQR
jgi:phosphatidylinositol alpha-1,6-mannosyltransferase